ncbi:MAG: hypothetical protein KGJ61_02865 [Candidatus Omnitrophica bacterium]|nr:hypothetical protein [Candidatus Omnitrophota bacterium]
MLLSLAAGGAGVAGAQQNADNQSQPPMSPAIDLDSIPAATVDPRQALMEQLHFNAFQAAKGGLSLCGGDEGCLSKAKGIRRWICAYTACQGNTGKEPTECFYKQISQYPLKTQEELASLICPVLNSPGAGTRQAFFTHVPDFSKDDEGDTVAEIAYVLALKGSASSCEEYVKDYVGPYGPNWNFNWYRALSGCRILADVRTPEQESKDFYTWFGVAQGTGSCSDIVNSEMRDACNAPGAGSPIPGQ